MTEWIVQPNASATYINEDGNEEFGELQWAFRRPGDHLMVFSGVSADQPQPDEDPMSLAGDYEEVLHASQGEMTEAQRIQNEQEAQRLAGEENAPSRSDGETARGAEGTSSNES